jgi:hypothetical protein
VSVISHAARSWLALLQVKVNHGDLVHGDALQGRKQLGRQANEEGHWGCEVVLEGHWQQWKVDMVPPAGEVQKELQNIIAQSTTHKSC